jgi:hypothetical protein
MRPGVQAAQASHAGRHAQLADAAAKLVDGDRDVHIGVGVDPGP